MAYSVAQIEKHTIVTRLSVSIYKMTDEQLRRLSGLLENSGDPSASFLSVLPDNGDPIIRRQMVIARIFILIKQLDKDSLLERLRMFADPEFRWVREYPRLSCYLSVDFATKERAYRSRIRDISAGGVFIETTDGFAKDQQISLCFTLSESDENMPFKIKGRVVRVYQDGIGVQYENISNYQRDIIDTLIKKCC